MKVLWIGNIMLPSIADEVVDCMYEVKEGWVTGMVNLVMDHQPENGIDFYYAFPSDPAYSGFRSKIRRGQGLMRYFCFYEDKANPHIYSGYIEDRIQELIDEIQPDLVHCFGTEYGHTLAVARCLGDSSKLLISIQGLCSVYSKAFLANLPHELAKRYTLRDYLKQDNIIQQKNKFEIRGEREIDAISMAGSLAGRTAFDRYYCQLWNKDAPYYVSREILRPEFYTDSWPRPDRKQHSIFVSQGDYPIKGIHYMLLAMPGILARYPDATLNVAGNNLIRRSNWKDILKRSSYGRYLLAIIAENHLNKVVNFTEPLREGEMKRMYLTSDLYVCCSTLENSPNSLGEAMLLGVPCVAADVGGIPDMFIGGVDGILYHGYRSADISFYEEKEGSDDREVSLEEQVHNLEQAVLTMWSDREKMKEYGRNARAHALITHDPEKNYQELMAIYDDIYARISGNLDS
jgi:glycosyltransferase involved in cell wall biosynthesis